jgi:hypothetical protein
MYFIFLVFMVGSSLVIVSVCLHDAATIHGTTRGNISFVKVRNFQVLPTYEIQDGVHMRQHEFANV